MGNVVWEYSDGSKRLGEIVGKWRRGILPATIVAGLCLWTGCPGEHLSGNKNVRCPMEVAENYIKNINEITLLRAFPPVGAPAVNEIVV